MNAVLRKNVFAIREGYVAESKHLNGWQVTRLGDHVDLLCGYPFKSQDYSPHPHDIPLLRGDNIAQGKTRWKNAKYWPRNKVHGLEKYHLFEGDIVIAMDQTLISAGPKVAVITASDMPCLLLQRVARLRTKPTLQQELLKQLLFSHQFEQYVKSVQTMTVVPHISAQHIKNFPVLLPPYAQQKIIIEVLQEWDNAIEKMETLMALKEQQFVLVLRGLMNNISGNYYSCSLKDISNIKKGQQINRVNIAETGLFPVWNGGMTPYGYTNKYNTYENTITISEGGSCGFVNYSHEKFWLGGHCYALERINENIYPEFLFFFLKYHEHSISMLKVGSALTNIRRKDIERIEVRYQNFDEQRRIAHILRASRYEIDLLKKLTRQYRIQKLGLMQKLFSI